MAEVIKRCLGTGAPQAVLVGDDEAGGCPWWEKTELLWRPCSRRRLTATSPCPVHTHSKPSPTLCLGSDDRLAAVEQATAFLWDGDLYWCSSASGTTVREDGTPIAGLYATGVSAASVMGRTSPGSGVNIGPSFVWGYVAAKDAVAAG